MEIDKFKERKWMLNNLLSQKEQEGLDLTRVSELLKLYFSLEPHQSREIEEIFKEIIESIYAQRTIACLEKASVCILRITPTLSMIQVKCIIEVVVYNLKDSPVQDVKVSINHEHPLIFSLDTKQGRVYIFLGEPRRIHKTKVFLEAEGEKIIVKISYREPIVFVSPHFHYDSVWLEDQSAYLDVTFPIIKKNIELAESNKKYKCVLSEIDYLKPYYDTFVKDRTAIRELIKEGRIETGGSYCEPAENLISGEGIIRNIIYGRGFHENVLGDKPEVYIPLDVFGHIPQLPQILRKSGFRGCIFSRANLPEQLLPLYFSVALDGTKLLTRKICYWDCARSVVQLKEEAKQRIKNFIKFGLNYDLSLQGDDFSEPNYWLVDNIKELEGGIPQIRIGTPKEYIKSVGKINPLLPKVSRDDSLYFVGTAISGIDLKIANRLCENRLLNAEKFSTIASLLGFPYPAIQIDKAWRQLLFAQHHDSITGTSCDYGYIDLMLGYREALQLATESLDEALSQITDKIDTSFAKGKAIIVFNPLCWGRTDVCELELLLEKHINRNGFEITDENGVEVNYEVLEKDREKARIRFIVRSVPSLGFKIYSIKFGNSLPESRKSTGMYSIANEFFKISIDKRSGGINSIFDKQVGKELIKLGAKTLGNEIIFMKEGMVPNKHPAWEIWTTGEKISSGNFPCEIEVEESSISKKIRIKSNIKGKCELLREITLYSGIRRIDFATYIMNYRGKKELAVVVFPVKIDNSLPVFEERFGALVRNKSKGWLDFRTTGEKMHSNCAMYAGCNWMDYSYSAKIEFVDENFKVMASYAIPPCAVITSHDEEERKLGYELIERLAKKGVTATPFYANDSLNDDILYSKFRISIGNNIYTRKLLIKHQIPPDLDYVWLEDKDVPPDWDSIPVLIIKGKNIKQSINKLFANFDHTAKITLPWIPNITKKRVEDYGVALINNGTIATSIENDGTICLALMHTAEWAFSHNPWAFQGQKLAEEFVPEHKTHAFFYSLYPHKGNWVNACVYRVGYEFNNKLIAKISELHNGKLRRKTSFLTVSPENFIITTLKPNGFPFAQFKAFPPGRLPNVGQHSGIILRGCEVVPKEKEVLIKKNNFLSIPVKLNKKEGFLRVDFISDDFHLYDCLNMGEFFKLVKEIKIDEDKITLNLINNNLQELQVTAWISVPMECWERELVDEYSLSSVFPMRSDFVVPPKKKKSIHFHLKNRKRISNERIASCTKEDFWAILKLAYNGYVEYIPIKTTIFGS